MELAYVFLKDACAKPHTQSAMSEILTSGSRNVPSFGERLIWSQDVRSNMHVILGYGPLAFHVKGSSNCGQDSDSSRLSP